MGDTKRRPTAEVWAMVAAERRELAELAASLSPGQWQIPSLCAGWRVRDVIAHVTVTAEFPARRHVAMALRHRLQLDRMIDRVARTAAEAPPDELVRRLWAAAGSRHHPPGRQARHLLSDVMIHAEDVRRPLGSPRAILPERLLVGLDTVSALRSLPAGRQRIAGLRLEAADLDWVTGDGPLVTGPGEALLMAIAGRAAACDDLQGPGVAILRDRSRST